MPQVIKSNDNEQRPSPSKIIDVKEVRRPAESNATNQQRNVKGIRVFINREI